MLSLWGPVLVKMGYLFVIVHDLILYDARINFSIPKIFFLVIQLILYVVQIDFMHSSN